MMIEGVNSVANLNREELLKRAAELEHVLGASKPKPSEKATAAMRTSAANLRRSATFPRSHIAAAHRRQPPFFGAPSRQKLSTTSGRNVARAPLSHNRVFVRKDSNEKVLETSASEDAKSYESLRRTDSAALLVDSSASTKNAESLLSAATCTNETQISAKSPLPSSLASSSARESQNEARATWIKNHENLVFSIGGDDSSEDDELIRNHHTALRNILHPVKPSIARSLQRKSVVFQSATKLVKMNSRVPETGYDWEKLKFQSQQGKACRLEANNKEILNERGMSTTIAETSKETRPDVRSDQQSLKVTTNSNSSSKSVAHEETLLKSLESGTASRGKRITSRGVRATWKSSFRKLIRLPNNDEISTTGPSGFKRVLKRTRFKLLRDVTASKKATSSHTKVAKRRATQLKANKKHLQTLLMLRGVPFQSSRDGKALKRINTSLTTTTLTPTKTSIKNRLQGAGSAVTRVASQLVNRSVYKLNKRKKNDAMPIVSCPRSVSNPESKKDCIFFIRFGKCHKGNTCKFQHDPRKVSICTKFLRGTCKTEKCPFSHKVDKDRMPLCSYFQQGQCNATSCPYRHSYFRKDIPHCESFLRGFCEKGQLCPRQHILVCTKAECSQNPKICPLFHKKKTKKSEVKTAAATRVRKQRTLVVRQKKSLDRGEAWPEFVTLSGSDDEVANVQMEMPSRASKNIERFLERRARPVWPDYSNGLSADPLDLWKLNRVNGQLRKTIRKAGWLRKVRPIKRLGDFIPLQFTPEPEPATVERSDAPATVKQRRRRRCRSKKYTMSHSVPSEESDDESFDLAQSRKERLFETDDDEEFDPAYRTYGEALRRTERMQSSLGSAESVSSYTSPSDSSDNSLVGKTDSYSFKILRNSRAVAAAISSESRGLALNDDDEWLLDYLYHCDQSVSPLPEPERLNFFGPVYEHWEFRIGDRIRETIEKFKCKLLPDRDRPPVHQAAKFIRPEKPSPNSLQSEPESVDFIPLRDHEEGEILSESEEELLVSGDDLHVVDMDLASDYEAVISPREDSGGEQENELGEEPLENDEEPHLLVDDVSDLEEGEVF